MVLFFLTKDEPTWAHHNHSKSIGYVRLNLGMVHSVGLDKCIIRYIHHCMATRTEYFQYPENSLCSACPSVTPTTDLSMVRIVLPFPECHVIGIIQYVASSD